MKTQEHDKLATRLIQILKKFNNGEKVSIDELADEFNVSSRTIQRDFQKMSYLPIVKKDGYYQLEEYSLGKLSFKDLKQFATFSGIKELYPQLSDSFIVDLLNTRINKTLEVSGHKYEDLSAKVDFFNTIATAIIMHKQIYFSYSDKNRVVNPYKLINTNGIWYLIGVDDGVLKNFTFSKILNLILSKESFIEDEEIIKALEDNKGVWFTQNHIEVKLDVDVEVSEYFLRRDLLPHQEVLMSTKDKLILFAKVAYEEEILKVVRYWIPHITIISPKYLQEKLEKSLINYLNDTTCRK